MSIKTRKRIVISVLTVFVLIVGLSAVWIGGKFIKHEKQQDADINSLRATVTLLKNQLKDDSTENPFTYKIQSGGGTTTLPLATA